VKDTVSASEIPRGHKIRTKRTVGFCESSRNFGSKSKSRFSPFPHLFSGAFRLYDVDNDGFITRDEMYNIVDAIYQMVVSASLLNYFLACEKAFDEKCFVARSSILLSSNVSSNAC